MEKREVKKVSLCLACEECPEVVFKDNCVCIGEKDNIVKLKREEWNELVYKIQSGELGAYRRRIDKKL